MNIFEVLIVQPIFNLLMGLYALIPGGDFGVSLIIFTILVRLALWPLVKKQLHQTKAMRKMQPELAAIKKRTKGNKQLEGMQMLELYKKHGIKPFQSIGILLIQLPVFIALFQVIQIITSHRDRVGELAYGFIENLAPIRAIIDNPDQFNETLFGVINLTERAISAEGINLAILAIVAGSAVLQYYTSKQTMPQQEGKKGLRQIMAEAAEGKQADQSEMNAAVMSKMVKFMPIMMFVVMAGLPGALALYYGVSNLVAVLQQGYILKQDEEEMIKVADEKPATPGKKATAKARAKAAKEADVVAPEKPASGTAKITRITAKDSAPKSKKRRS